MGSLPQRSQEGRGQEDHQRRPHRPHGPGREEPEGWIEGQEVAVAQRAPTGEVERPEQQEGDERQDHGHGQGPAPAVPLGGQEAQEERQEVGQDAHVPAEEEVDEVPSRELGIELRPQDLLLQPRGIALALHLLGPGRGGEVHGRISLAAVDPLALAAIARGIAAGQPLDPQGEARHGHAAQDEPQERRPPPGGRPVPRRHDRGQEQGEVDGAVDHRDPQERSGSAPAGPGAALGLEVLAPIDLRGRLVSRHVLPVLPVDEGEPGRSTGQEEEVRVPQKTWAKATEAKRKAATQ